MRLGKMMSTDLPRIGDRLRAYRMGAGLSVEAMASKLNMSRASLYRLEKEGINRLDVLERVAQMLNVSVASLLGVDVEFTASAVTYFERLRQIEAVADWSFVAFGPISYLLTSREYDRLLHSALREQANGRRRSPSSQLEELTNVLARRKAQYLARRFAITNIVAASDIERFARHGLASGESPISLAKHQRETVIAELEYFARLYSNPPFGVQIGISFETLPTTGFSILRTTHGHIVTQSPFRIAPYPNVHQGVAMITTSSEAVTLFNEVANSLWERAATGERAVVFLQSQIVRAKRAEKQA